MADDAASKPVRAFSKALRAEWQTLMTGAATIPLTAAALFIDTTWQRIAFGFFALLCALAASYRIWLTEHRRANALANALESKDTPTMLPSHELAFRQLKADNENLRQRLVNSEARTLLISQATQIEKGLKPIVDWVTPVYTRMAEMFVVATTGAPDSLHYAQSLSGPLKVAFHVEVIGPGEWHYDPQEATGLLLIEPSEFPADFPDYGQILIDAFASAGLTVTRYPSSGYLLRFILLVGRKSLD